MNRRPPWLHLRRPESTDTTALKELCSEIFPVHYSDTWYMKLTCTNAYFALLALDGPRVVGLVVCESQQLIRCSREERQILNSNFSLDTRIAYILSLGVTEEYRCKGIASLLLDLVLTFFSGCHIAYTNEYFSQQAIHDQHSSKHLYQTAFTSDPVLVRDPLIWEVLNQFPHLRFDTAHKAVYLHTAQENVNAQQFYQKRGFELHSVIPFFYHFGDGEHDGCIYVLYINGGYSGLPLSSKVLQMLDFTCGKTSLTGVFRSSFRMARFLFRRSFSASLSALTNMTTYFGSDSAHKSIQARPGGIFSDDGSDNYNSSSEPSNLSSDDSDLDKTDDYDHESDEGMDELQDELFSRQADAYLRSGPPNDLAFQNTPSFMNNPQNWPPVVPTDTSHVFPSGEPNFDRPHCPPGDYDPDCLECNVASLSRRHDFVLPRNNDIEAAAHVFEQEMEESSDSDSDLN